MAEKLLQVKNLTAGPVTATDGNATYTLAAGSQMSFPVIGTSINFQRDDASTFLVNADSSRTDVTVSASTASVSVGESFWVNYWEGFGLGVAIMFACLCLRMVKQLGYHSQDI